MMIAAIWAPIFLIPDNCALESQKAFRGHGHDKRILQEPKNLKVDYFYFKPLGVVRLVF